MKGRDLQFAEFLDVSVGNLGSLLLAKKNFCWQVYALSSLSVAGILVSCSRYERQSRLALVFLLWETH